MVPFNCTVTNQENRYEYPDEDWLDVLESYRFRLVRPVLTVSELPIYRFRGYMAVNDRKLC